MEVEKAQLNVAQMRVCRTRLRLPAVLPRVPSFSCLYRSGFMMTAINWTPVDGLHVVSTSPIVCTLLVTSHQLN